MRRKIIISILVSMLVFPTLLGAVSSSNIEAIKPLIKMPVNRLYTHDVLGEYFTMTTCDPCKYAHRALKNIFKHKVEWNKPFYYVTLVKDDNTHALARYDELLIEVTPTLAWDGDYRRDEGATGVQESMARFNTSIDICKNRNVADIDLDLDVTYLGAVDPLPADGATGVVVETNLAWWTTAMDIDYTIENNGASQYNGHLHIYVTEANSSYWKDKYGDPETFAFLDYAVNGNIAISGGSTYSNSVTWDGKTHSNGKGEFYDELREDNSMVVASIFSTSTDYTDESDGFRVGIGTDPKTYDIYFGTTNPPPKVLSNSSNRLYDPTSGDDHLEFNTTYYWKIDVWDNQGNPKYGTVWDFTTRPNNPPITPYDPDPTNNSIGIPINTNLSWLSGDLEFDTVTFDVYFGDNPNFLELISDNQSEVVCDPTLLENLEFNKKYYWKIVAWDEYGAKKEGPLWNFLTQVNWPPYPPSDPFPHDGASNVPDTGVTLTWNGTDPNPGDTLKYNVYFEMGDTTPDELVSENQTGTTWGTGELELYDTYYWKIKAFDLEGKSNSATWSFTVGENDPPNKPSISGPIRPRVGGTYEYTFSATDNNGDDVSFWIAWGDGTSTGWTKFVPSGEELTVNHTWSKKGTYNVRARAKDLFGAEGEWSQLEVIVPLNMQSSQQSQSPFIFKTLGQLMAYSKLNSNIS